MTRRTRVAHVALVGAVLAVLGGANVAAAPQSPQSSRAAGDVLFVENFDAAGNHGWTTSHEAIDDGECPSDEWHKTTTTHAGAGAWTNDPYTPAIKTNPLGSGNCLNHLDSPSIGTAGHGQSLELVFWEKHFTEGPNDVTNPCNPPSNEPPCDFGIVAVSKNGGEWKGLEDPLMPVMYSGGTPTDPYTLRKLKLGAAHFSPGDSIRIRFTFSSDAYAASPPYGPFTGWYIDDVALCEVACPANPTAVRVKSFTATAAAREVTLRWRTASEVSAAGFNVWRTSLGESAKVNTALVAARSGGAGGASYRLRDTAVRPGVGYSYRLQAVAPDGRRTWIARARVVARR